MVPQRERRKQLAEIERRSWQLWALSLMIMGLLALGIVLFFYPALRAPVEYFGHRHLNLPQLVLGLFSLVVLSGFYVVTKQRELNALRNFIIAAYTAAAVSRDAYPRDSLTGALDRSALPDVLRHESARAERTHSSLCLVLFDIQKFHLVNEREGNMVGDLVLKELALTLQRTARQTDTVLRYGGDQFLCLLAGTPREGADPFVRRIHIACERVSRLRNLILDFGIAVHQAGADPEATVAEAEQDLAARRQILPPTPSINAPAH